MDKKKNKNEWTRRWKNWVKPTRLPNVWQRKEGGHLVRARVKDPTTGQLKEIKKVMPDADGAMAFKWLQDERAKMRAGFARVQPPSAHFGDYAVSIFEKKSAPGGKIKSGAGHVTYSEEEPNSLPAEKVGEFLQNLRRIHPAHYAMTYLGFVTGLRPSSLRPLRRRGPQADVLWEKNRILVRRSQTAWP
jgi:integrase